MCNNDRHEHTLLVTCEIEFAIVTEYYNTYRATVESCGHS